MEGSIVNQIEITGFNDENDVKDLRKRLKSFKTPFSLHSLDRTLNFKAEEASWKEKDNHSLVYLFLTEDSHPGEEISKMAKLFPDLEIRHLVISPSGCGEVILNIYHGSDTENHEYSGTLAKMLGDLVQGGFQI